MRDDGLELFKRLVMKKLLLVIALLMPLQCFAITKAECQVLFMYGKWALFFTYCNSDMTPKDLK